MIGIYKVTSPNGRVYIGQSVDIDKRFNRYKTLCSSTIQQTLLYRSLIKYGPEKHSFEVIIECDPSELNEYERFYQDLYNACDSRSGLNCRLTSATDRSPFFSEETRKKLREKATGRKHSAESRLKMSESAKNRPKSKRGKYKLKPPELRPDLKVKTIEQVLLFKKLNDEGISTEKIGEMFSINGSTVRKHLRKLKKRVSASGSCKNKKNCIKCQET